MERGKTIYEAKCITCHMANGEGLVSVYPSIARSENVKQKEKLVQVILKGIRGPVKVNDKSFNGEMAGLALNDNETADVINYIRNTWGNKAPAVLPKEIKPALKAAVKDYKPY